MHLIARVVGEMRHLWHPTAGVDSGIDGQIELRDPATGEVRNVRIGVQSKAKAGKWDRETDRGFTYRPKPKDVAYWLSSNQPVLLICVRPAKNEAYWRSMQEWVADPKARASGVVRFDKTTDRFDAGTADQLFDLRARPNDRVEPPGPSPTPETLLTNLMPIRWRSDNLWSAAIPTSDPKELFEPAWRRDLNHPAGAIAQGRFWSFSDIHEAFLEAIGASDIQCESLNDKVASASADDQNLLKDLVPRAVVERTAPLAWHSYKKLAYFQIEGEQEDVRYAWSSGPGRTVVSVQFAKVGDRHFTGYRHDAAELLPRKCGDSWFLQVSPTYLFTWNGRQISGHHDSALAGIKKLEKHRAVSNALRMWEHLLLERLTLEQPQGDADFSLGRLVSVEVEAGINEKSWEKLSETEALEAQGRFFSEGEAWPD